MAGIASIAKESGISVSGCDANVYPPMSTLLESLSIEIQQGYEPKQLPSEVSEFVIGNALSRGNSLVEHILEMGLKYTSGPQWLAENILSSRQTYAVAGTHGKTSTSSMLTWLLEQGDLDPGFLIGGKPGNFNYSARLGSGKQFVVEADEYDTAYFDKRSKFVHYRPSVAVLNNLEFDHADIFADLNAIKTQFHHLIRTVPGNGKLIVNQDDLNLADVLSLGSWSPIETFSTAKPTANWYARADNNVASEFTVFQNQQVACKVKWPCFGEHNMSNALAAIAAAHHAGITPSKASEVLGSFILPSKRLQVHTTKAGFILYEDFAHHPTAIAKTLETLKQKHPTRRLVAILEPRSNTMRTAVHAASLPNSLALADLIYYLKPDELGWSLSTRNAHAFKTVKQGVAELQSALDPQDIVVVMSNGDFEGMVPQLKNLN